jgi:subtilisin family serine protease
LSKHKYFILYEREHEDNIISEFTRNSMEVVKRGEDNTVNTLMPYDDNNKNETRNWAVMANTLDQLSDSLVLLSSATVLYTAPFFTTLQGDEAGLSHLFYVRLFRAEDIGLLEALARETHVNIIGRNKFMSLWYTLYCTKYSDGNALEMANSFYESGLFKAAEPDLMGDDLTHCVNDDYFSDQWNLNNTGKYGGTSGIDIDICEAWEVTRGCDSITIALVDQGTEMEHPDLTNMFELSYDTELGTPPSDVFGPHGTACSGIAGAASDNNEGIAGIAPECQLMSISNTLILNINSRQQLADGINWAWNNGADVINNSWGHDALAGDFIDDAVENALTYGREGLGCVIVFAAGNDNGNVEYPANSNPDIIAVGAMSPCGERKSPTSCDTEDWGSNYGNQLDLIAPGVLIPTTDLQGDGQYNSTFPIHTIADGNKISSDYLNRDYTIWFHGTSAAAPHVAGVAALILSVNPGLTQDQVRDIIESTCTKVGSYNYTTVAGRGNFSKLNLYL